MTILFNTHAEQRCESKKFPQDGTHILKFFLMWVCKRGLFIYYTYYKNMAAILLYRFYLKVLVLTNVKAEEHSRDKSHSSLWLSI